MRESMQVSGDPRLRAHGSKQANALADEQFKKSMDNAQGHLNSVDARIDLLLKIKASLGVSRSRASSNSVPLSRIMLALGRATSATSRGRFDLQAGRLDVVR
jgi:hypothetical protein